MISSPEFTTSVLDLYQSVLHDGIWKYLQKDSAAKTKCGIYCAQVVLWLMMLQRLQKRGTLASAVRLLQQGAADPLLRPCRRVRQGRISGRTGGYCQARQKVPTLLCKQVSQEIVARLREVLNSGEPKGPQSVFVLDGSTLELEHSPELVRLYPPGSNQHGRGHWPILRLVVLHDAATGLAQKPCWGPRTVSEQALAEQAIRELPPGSTILADRNFGVFSVAYAAQQKGAAVILRLTDVRARKLCGAISEPGEYSLTWKPSQWDGGRQASWPADAAIPGRVIAARFGLGKSKQWLYLFTTLPGSLQHIVELYGERWNVETDLRSLKRTVQLQHISVKTADLLEKELLMAISAYNLVRAVMCMAARRSRTDPRQLSFTGVLTVVECAWHKLTTASDKKTHDREFLRVLDMAAECRLPKRSKHRSYPRLLWRRGGEFRFRKAEQN